MDFIKSSFCLFSPNNAVSMRATVQYMQQQGRRALMLMPALTRECDLFWPEYPSYLAPPLLERWRFPRLSAVRSCCSAFKDRAWVTRLERGAVSDKSGLATKAPSLYAMRDVQWTYNGLAAAVLIFWEVRHRSSAMWDVVHLPDLPCPCCTATAHEITR